MKKQNIRKYAVVAGIGLLLSFAVFLYQPVRTVYPISYSSETWKTIDRAVGKGRTAWPIDPSQLQKVVRVMDVRTALRIGEKGGKEIEGELRRFRLELWSAKRVEGVAEEGEECFLIFQSGNEEKTKFGIVISPD